MNKFKMDSHMHFDLYNNRKKILDYIEENHSYTIAMTNLPILYEKYYHLYKDYKYIRIALGFHPELVYKFKTQITTFKKLVNTTRYIGEIGLDYYNKTTDDKKIQKIVFKEIINTCSSDSNKIISVHSRKAEKDCLEILENFNGTVILHWYTGSINNLKKAIDRGYFFSVNHQMIKSNNGKKIINLLPLDKIILESDAPFTFGLESDYNLNFIDLIIEYISINKNIPIQNVYNQIKLNFKTLLNTL